MFIVPELEWGAVLLLIPVSLLLLILPFVLGWRLHLRSVVFQLLAIIVFVVAGLIVSMVPQDPMSLLGCTIGGTLLLYLVARLTLLSEGWNAHSNWLLASGVAAAIFACLLRLAFGGWLIIAEFGTGFAFAPFIFHADLRALSLARAGRVVPGSLMIASDLLLLVGAALRIDMGDGDRSLTALALLYSPGSAAALPPAPLSGLREVDLIWWNVLVLLPAALTWGLTVLRLLGNPGDPEQANAS